jgi:pyruvate dehydrogenase E1 component alpha subunit
MLERHILAEGIATQDEFESIDASVEVEIDEAVRFAEESPLPSPEDLFRNIYVEA